LQRHVSYLTRRAYSDGVIVVVGQPFLREGDKGPMLDGPAALVAVAAAERGRPVQLVGTAGEDEAGDQLVLALASAGVGHVALLRKTGQHTPVLASVELGADDPLTDDDDERSGPRAGTAPLDAADVDLALRYLPDVSVLVLAEPTSRETIGIVAQAAQWSDARLVLVIGGRALDLDGVPDDAIVFEEPPDDPDGAFAGMVGAFAAALDEGDEPGEAFRATLANEGWAASEP
jgi:hypothetical protein